MKVKKLYLQSNVKITCQFNHYTRDFINNEKLGSSK